MRLGAVGDPFNELGLTTSIAGGNDRRPDAEFGLTHYTNRVYAFGVDAVPREGTLFGASYAQFLDPTRNWSTNAFERVHTANVSADLLRLAPKTELRLSYDLSHSRARYDYVVPVTTTLPAISQLPPLLNELHHAVVDARYRLRRDMTLGLVYGYDRYRVDDFALDSEILNRIDMTAGVLLLANAYRPYRASTFVMRMTYVW